MTRADCQIAKEALCIYEGAFSGVESTGIVQLGACWARAAVRKTPVKKLLRNWEAPGPTAVATEYQLRQSSGWAPCAHYELCKSRDSSSTETKKSALKPHEILCTSLLS